MSRLVVLCIYTLETQELSPNAPAMPTLRAINYGMVVY